MPNREIKMTGNVRVTPLDQKLDAEPIKEFGGAWGVFFIMLGSHLVLYYLWIAWRFYGGALIYPHGFSDVLPFFNRFFNYIVNNAAPTWEAWGIYLTFLIIQGIFATFLPGIKIKGLPIPSKGNVQLEYQCNGISAWYITLALIAVLHFTAIFPLTKIYNQFGSLMTVAIISGDIMALIIYWGAKLTQNTHRMSNNFWYDYFMGAWLNPRIGKLDLKMWAEIRIAWILLFLLTLSAAAHQYATYHVISTPMIFMVLAHGLYTNACMKGEECIPTTWDIFYEKWGWMLIFWNFAGVPFVYCFNSMYIASHTPFEHSLPYTLLCFALLIGAYYVWDTSQSQRNRFRMQERGTYVKRKAFPQLPWGTLKNPTYFQTKHGSLLLTDGWWRYARKIHYTADIVMALSWGLICGFNHFLPYFYVIFFVGMIAHRARRDINRCRQKYGEDWDHYCKKVPWLFIPFIF
ncbi:delta(24(24(1)))-sterol reductase [Coxiella burnetii]|uniref:delta(24(24(1)))-sterol reductase n=1 Tax=Coxiella burnetii TaxID=777 RepID=UPI000509B8C4|nr:delta(24(24(1)))-sterol reductase [Coxiella burnetii]PHH56842.1 delta(24(24(1)))-sterol reductase [Coxiella burnetii]